VQTKPRVVIPTPSAGPPTKKISAGGYHFEADEQDRTVRAHGDLRLQPDQRRSKPEQSRAGKPDRMPEDHGGHFIGRQFGGPEISYNHFAQNARFNTSGYRKLENLWKKQLKAGKKVHVDIGVLYAGDSRRPRWLNVTYYTAGKRYLEPFANTKKGK
jgi:DNA/RNA non-specific endonuclease